MGVQKCRSGMVWRYSLGNVALGWVTVLKHVFVD